MKILRNWGLYIGMHQKCAAYHFFWRSHNNFFPLIFHRYPFHLRLAKIFRRPCGSSGSRRGPMCWEGWGSNPRSGLLFHPWSVPLVILILQRSNLWFLIVAFMPGIDGGICGFRPLFRLQRTDRRRAPLSPQLACHWIEHILPLRCVGNFSLHQCEVRVMFYLLSFPLSAPVVEL